MIANDHIFLSGLIFFLAGVSDILDGYFARKFNTANPRGRLIDSGSDFILIISLLVYFYLNGCISIFSIFIITGLFCDWLLNVYAVTAAGRMTNDK